MGNTVVPRLQASEGGCIAASSLELGAIGNAAPRKTDVVSPSPACATRCCWAVSSSPGRAVRRLEAMDGGQGFDPFKGTGGI